MSDDVRRQPPDGPGGAARAALGAPPHLGARPHRRLPGRRGLACGRSARASPRRSRSRCGCRRSPTRSSSTSGWRSRSRPRGRGRGAAHRGGSARLVTALAEVLRLPGRPEDVLARDLAFHRALAEATHNPLLIGFAGATATAFRRFAVGRAADRGRGDGRASRRGRRRPWLPATRRRRGVRCGPISATSRATSGSPDAASRFPRLEQARGERALGHGQLDVPRLGLGEDATDVLDEDVERVPGLVALPEAAHPRPVVEHPARAGAGADGGADRLVVEAVGARQRERLGRAGERGGHHHLVRELHRLPEARPLADLEDRAAEHVEQRPRPRRAPRRARTP